MFERCSMKCVGEIKGKQISRGAVVMGMWEVSRRRVYLNGRNRRSIINAWGKFHKTSLNFGDLRETPLNFFVLP